MRSRVQVSLPLLETKRIAIKSQSVSFFYTHNLHAISFIFYILLTELIIFLLSLAYSRQHEGFLQHIDRNRKRSAVELSLKQIP